MPTESISLYQLARWNSLAPDECYYDDEDDEWKLLTYTGWYCVSEHPDLHTTGIREALEIAILQRTGWSFTISLSNTKSYKIDLWANHNNWYCKQHSQDSRFYPKLTSAFLNLYLSALQDVALASSSTSNS